MKYGLVMRFKLRELYPLVRETEDSINSFMHDCGFSETMFMQSEYPLFTLETDRALTEEEKVAVVSAMNKSLKEHEKFDMECIGIELQSGG